MKLTTPKTGKVTAAKTEASLAPQTAEVKPQQTFIDVLLSLPPIAVSVDSSGSKYYKVDQSSGTLPAKYKKNFASYYNDAVGNPRPHPINSPTEIFVDDLVEGNLISCIESFKNRALFEKDPIPQLTKEFSDLVEKNIDSTAATMYTHSYSGYEYNFTTSGNSVSDRILRVKEVSQVISMVNRLFKKDFTALACDIASKVKITKEKPCYSNIQKTMAGPINNSFVHEALHPDFFDEAKVESMRNKVTSHLNDFLPGYKITTLRPVKLIYQSDGAMANTPDAVNSKGLKVSYTKEGNILVDKDVKDQEWSAPILYAGNGWALRITIDGLDPLPSNIIYFATPEQFIETYKDCRPDLLEGFKHWSDLIFICSLWCERNGDKAKLSSGVIDLQSPIRKRLALWQWILGPMLNKCNQTGTKFPSLKHITHMCGFDNRTKLAKLEELIKK